MCTTVDDGADSANAFARSLSQLAEAHGRDRITVSELVDAR
jgi:hypothetical protein